MTPVLIGVGLGLLAGAIVATLKAPRLTAILLWSLLATIFLTSAALLTLPGPFSEKALWLALSVPITWATLQFWCYWDGRKWRVTGTLIALTVVGALVVAMVDPAL